MRTSPRLPVAGGIRCASAGKALSTMPGMLSICCPKITTRVWSPCDLAHAAPPSSSSDHPFPAALALALLPVLENAVISPTSRSLDLLLSLFQGLLFPGCLVNI